MILHLEYCSFLNCLILYQKMVIMIEKYKKTIEFYNKLNDYQNRIIKLSNKKIDLLNEYNILNNEVKEILENKLQNCYVDNNKMYDALINRYFDGYCYSGSLFLIKIQYYYDVI